jgi:hypothetical protein
MYALLQRFETGDQGTFGRIMVPGLTLFTGELPWRENAGSISCIPAGVYPAQMTWSPRFKRLMYLLGKTDPRVGIRAHSANFMGDKSLGYRMQLNGCIALGEQLGWMEGQKALLLSAPAVRRFENHMGHKPFMLEIRDA